MSEGAIARAKARLLDLNPAQPDTARLNELAVEWGQIFDDLELDWSDAWDAHFDASPEFTRRTGLEWVGGGQTRMVFALDDQRVLKLAFMGDSGAEASARECALWFRLAQEQPALGRRLLAPVLGCAAGGEWLVMERATKVEDTDLPVLDWGSPTDVILEGLGVSDTRGRGQWGRLGDGRVVLVDYGGLDG